MKKLSRVFGQHLASTRNRESAEQIEQSKDDHKSGEGMVSEIFQKEGFNLCQILGNFNKAFVICCFNENIYLIDQHAASEKSLYVRFLRQKNLLPLPYNGKPLQILNIYREILQKQRDIFKNLGWTYEILSSGPVFLTVQLTWAPCIMDRQCCETEFLQIVESYYENEIQSLSRSQKQSMATIACHNAYRIGDELTRDEMRELVDTLYEMSGAYNCPHSRPIIIMLGNAHSFTRQPTQRKYELW